jgi:hypothetical protein
VVIDEICGNLTALRRAMSLVIELLTLSFPIYGLADIDLSR